jgi:hypothetical protein
VLSDTCNQYTNPVLYWGECATESNNFSFDSARAVRQGAWWIVQSVNCNAASVFCSRLPLSSSSTLLWVWVACVERSRIYEIFCLTPLPPVRKDSSSSWVMTASYLEQERKQKERLNDWLARRGCTGISRKRTSSCSWASSWPWDYALFAHSVRWACNYAGWSTVVYRDSSLQPSATLVI